MTKKRILMIVIIIILLSLFLLWRNLTHQTPIIITNIKASYETIDTSQLNVVLNIENQGGPDRLISVNSALSSNIEISTPSSIKDIAIPALSKPSFSSDGAFITLKDLPEPLDIGDTFPISFTFENSVDIRGRAIIAKSSNPHAGHNMAGNSAMAEMAAKETTYLVKAGEPAPEIKLNAQKDGDQWNIAMVTKAFTLIEATEGMSHQTGFGHGHLYLNGLKLQRVYTPSVKIGQLPKGTHLINVTLNTNDHKAYMVDGSPVAAEIEITVD
jgi:copper(I)-binding protein